MLLKAHSIVRPCLYYGALNVCLLLMQNAAEKLQQLERDANAANQEVVQLADELEQRDERIEQLQEDLQGREQLLRQQEERLAARYGADHVPCTCPGGGPTRKGRAAMLLTEHGVRL